ncbi:YbbR family protein [Thermoclostridium stercorarium subsp. stercorarium DSM 8532]|uniref:YbbR family protein n=2 Tax=Thermoclostridium stercorarium TaxID=1510 RepID=L7VN57_THES1|nr:CdaR family protein [Thermoclostridium stercorarium]AGC68104.1 YbbR family protein [Thermoclostridium stercorarium subsp. stercorarium DSM 8532]AGI39129.1 hypothetical protein Clst_1059 [Thermoclostridium stercorarium subsp. stercorarium DSM 8532]ANW98486.1 hypothetical protein CSTERTH_05240 [Thermoclostridium stercorarium subsp. thermolacticum DSM 2910]
MIKIKNINLNKIVEKDSFLRVISVLIGILIWFIVLDHQNPLVERTISIPLRTNVQILDSSNIRLVSSNIPTNVDVVIKGRKQRVDKVTANDFEAFLDFSGIQDTSITELRIDLPKYTGDQDIIVADVNPKVVKIRLENIVRKEFPVNVKWVGELPEGYEIVNVKLNPNTVILQDLESVMDSVESVVVSVDVEQVLTGETITKRIEVYNSNGRLISSLDGSVQVAVDYNVAKTVPVSTTLTGEPKDDYYVQDYTLSQNTVKITGNYDVLKRIESIEAEQLSVENASESFQKDLNLILPDNVQLYNSPPFVTAHVNIRKYSHKIVTIPRSSITIFGGDISGQTKYRILEDEITFSVKGPSEILETLNVKSVKGFVDVSGTTEGVQPVIVRISLPSGIYLEGEVYVNIETERATPSPTPTPTPVPGSESELSPTPAPNSEGTGESPSGT